MASVSRSACGPRVTARTSSSQRDRRAEPEAARHRLYGRREIEKAGGKALPLLCDVRSEEQVQDAVAKAIERFGGIDILVNNARDQFDRHAVDADEALRPDASDQSARHVPVLAGLLPHLKGEQPARAEPVAAVVDEAQVVRRPRRLHAGEVRHEQCVLGMAEEFKNDGVAFNALWPRTAIATAAVMILGGDAMMKHSRTPDIMAGCGVRDLQPAVARVHGQLLVDDDVLRAEGVTDFKKYAVDPSVEPVTDFFLD